MSTLTRALAQVDRAADKKTKSHENLREKLDESFIALYNDWKFYKDNTGMSDEDFNKVNSDTGKPDILHNDKWFKDLEEKYFTLCDKSDEALTLPNDSTNETESKETNIVNVDLLVGY